MASGLAREIRERLARYLTEQMPLSQFDGWLTRSTWDLDRDADPEAAALADEIILRLAEFGRGHWREDELRDHFESLQPAWLNPSAAASDAATDTVIVVEQPLTWGPTLHLWPEPEKEPTRTGDVEFRELKIPA
jgi:hypothetical protein